MKSSKLLPHSFTLPIIAGLVCFIVLLAANNYGFEFDVLDSRRLPLPATFERNNFTDEVALSGVILMALLLAFTRQKTEDEYLATIRLRCWQWAIIGNFVVLLCFIWLAYGFAFLAVLMWNMVTPLAIYHLLFYSKLLLLNLQKPASPL